MNQPATSLARNHFLDALRGIAAAMVSAKACSKPGQMYYFSACRLGRSLWQKLRQNPIQLLRPCQLPQQHHPPQPAMGRLAHRCLAGGCGCRSRRLLRSNCSIGVAIQVEATKRQGQGIALLRTRSYWISWGPSNGLAVNSVPSPPGATFRSMII